MQCEMEETKPFLYARSAQNSIISNSKQQQKIRRVVETEETTILT